MKQTPSGLIAPAPVGARDRVLSDAELAVVWSRATAVGYPIGPIVKLLILTAQRRGEVAAMQWSEIDKGSNCWTIPPERSKNKCRHTLPLSPQVLAILNSIPAIGNLVFPGRGKAASAVVGFPKMMERFVAGAGSTTGRCTTSAGQQQPAWPVSAFATRRRARPQP